MSDKIGLFGRAWHRAVYLAARAAFAVLRLLPLPASLFLARRGGELVYGLLPRWRRVALENLAQTFPERTPRARRRLARESFRHFAMCFVEMLHFPRLAAPARLADWITEPAPRAELDRALAAGRGLICVTGHVGSWEVTGLGVAALGLPFNALARPLANPLLWAYLVGLREAGGIRILAGEGAARACLRALREGQILGVVMDQNAGRHGVLVDFLGRPASTLRLPAELALRLRCPVLAGAAFRLGRRLEYGFRYSGEIPLPASGDHERDVLELCRRMNEAIGALVRERPEQYLWAHRRWRLKPEWFPEAAAPRAAPGAAGQPTPGNGAPPSPETGG